jgi:hypothetical protein
MVFTGAVAVTPLLAQDDATTENDPYRLYTLCVANIRNVPLEAYSPCERYLEQTPSSDDNTPQVKYVKTWIARYEKVLPYLQFLQGLTTDKNAPWFVYEPDMVIQLPETSDTEGPYKIQISRSFRGLNEEEMLRKAEAVYSSPSKMVADVLRSLRLGRQTSGRDGTNLGNTRQ